MRFEQGPQAHWCPHGKARCDFGRVKQTIHVVSPPMLDSDTAETISVMRALIVQLEARVRLLEHEAMSTAMLDRKHQIVTDTNKSYQEFVKARKQDPSLDSGSPTCQAACSILVALKDWPYKDTSARISKLKFAT